MVKIRTKNRSKKFLGRIHPVKNTPVVAPATELPLVESKIEENPDLEYADLGEPSNDAVKDLHRVMKLIGQERHLIAYSLYNSVVSRLYPSDTNTHSLPNHDEVRQLLYKHQLEFEKLKEYAKMFQRAKQNAMQDQDWIQCHDFHNVKSSYRREKDGSLSLKIEGEIKGLPLFEQVSIMREVDLYHYWAPFVHKSRKLAALGKLDQVGWYEVGGMGMVRDSCYRAIGCDCMMETGEIVVVAVGLDENDHNNDGDDDDDDPSQSSENGESDSNVSFFNHDMHPPSEQSPITSQCRSESCDNFLARDAILDTIELPPKPRGFNKDRLHLRFFEAVIQVDSPTSATTHLVANMDVKMKIIPDFIIEFIMKHMCGFLLIKMQGAARKALEKPEHAPHAVRMREDSFYRSWLLPKFQSYCQHKGWEMPKVKALEGLDLGNGEEKDDAEATLETTKIRDAATTGATSSISSRKLVWSRNPFYPKLSERSVQSAPTRMNDDVVSSKKSKFSFTNTQKQRLEELRNLKRMMGKEPTALEEMRMSVTKALKKERKTGSITHLVNDYSHLTVLPVLFLFQFVVYHAIDYNRFFTDDHTIIRQMSTMAAILSIFAFIHWATIEAIFVSAFDTIDLPVPKFTGFNESSNTRQYFIERIRLSTIFFSIGLVMMGTAKELADWICHQALHFIQYAVAIATNNHSLYFETHPVTEGDSVWLQVIDNTKMLLTYSSVFLGVCCGIAVANYPSKAGKPVKITHGPNSPTAHLRSVHDNATSTRLSVNLDSIPEGGSDRGDHVDSPESYHGIVSPLSADAMSIPELKIAATM